LFEKKWKIERKKKNHEKIMRKLEERDDELGAWLLTWMKWRCWMFQICHVERDISRLAMTWIRSKEWWRRWTLQWRRSWRFRLDTWSHFISRFGNVYLFGVLP